MRRIGIVYPRAARHLLAITSVQLSLKDSFPGAEITHLDHDDLHDAARLSSCDMVVLPPSHGEVTPYEFLGEQRIAARLLEYAQEGAVAGFCSGAYALTDRFTYRYRGGETRDYRGYVPLIRATAAGPEDFDETARDGGSRFSDVRLLEVFAAAAGGASVAPVCYASGPGYDTGRHDPQSRALASFASGRAAIIAQRVGTRGIVVGFGALPEIAAAQMPANFAPWITVMKDRMAVAESARRALWDAAMDILAHKELYPASRRASTASPSSGPR